MTEKDDHPTCPERPYDVVLFGATGFAGGLTADYLVEHLPESGRMALAGRNRDKLEAVRDRLTGINPDVSDIGLLHADSTDPASLTEVARSAKVVITTVGPYLEYGAALVAACAEEGTDYVDLTGEPEFVDRMFLGNDATARQTGARLVHACGFDSIPHDLGALYTARNLPANAPMEIRGVVRTNASLSGGTLHSALKQLSRLRPMWQAASQRRRAESTSAGRRARLTVRFTRRDRVTGTWLIPLPTIDGQIVTRSALTAPSADDYGPDFSYSHNAGAKKLRTVPASLVGFVVGIAAVQIAPVRRAIARRIAAGEGPSQERRDRTWFTVEFVGTAAGRTVHTRVRGGDPGYTETAKMLAESALSLAFDDNPALAGQLTTATAMGGNLIDRLTAAGMSFEVLSHTP
ncbi:saccharopine dehydrogenase family protein [Corynebacterium variabile]|uniref:saccharopine dehydrogenase family protein n=1 Tax=Corynebacterium variabile TaxID=1727 RepID=UPI00289FA319|nr:saccharopine dehydrogenase NADP-binding domain-containing protein [Corynebacterium variabile]